MFDKTLRMLGAVVAVILFCTASDAAGAGRHELALSVNRVPVRYISNVVYAQKPMRGYANVALRMDILQPESREPLPAVVFVTGGGLVSANKDSFLQQCLDLAEAGYVVASIEYRVAPAVVFPSPLEDVKSAIRFLRAKADIYGINPDKIAVFGESAGGYLAAITGTTNGRKEFDVGGYLEQSSRVVAVVDFYGLSDLTLIGEGFPDDVVRRHESPASTEALWVNGSTPFYRGGAISDHPEKAAAASPITYIDAAAPPFLIMHGDRDILVSPRQSERLHAALR
ncbi:alpha/beta hydrolase [Cloacibacillus porcorum]|uniref:alpha/beta hydrolase n=1 Tax=Cloacibacillus porcorum TaxID=1197717 RepID=UPI0023537621|nr:alpha/beta hydrolase [Cloacibacillus porcorum]MCI5863682.1 alpha/beta hydrolase [Cloacibacillus porcorum]